MPAPSLAAHAEVLPPWRVVAEPAGRWPHRPVWVVTDGGHRFEYTDKTDARWMCERLNWLASFTAEGDGK